MDNLQSHIDRHDKLIERLARNGDLSKGWCISALAGIAWLKGSLFAYQSAVAIFMFWFLNGHYLALERFARDSSNLRVSPNLGSIKIPQTIGVRFRASVKAMGAMSVWIFYVTLGLIALTATAIQEKQEMRGIRNRVEQPARSVERAWETCRKLLKDA
jgi:hypothetical protein